MTPYGSQNQVLLIDRPPQDPKNHLGELANVLAQEVREHTNHPDAEKVAKGAEKARQQEAESNTALGDVTDLQRLFNEELARQEEDPEFFTFSEKKSEKVKNSGSSPGGMQLEQEQRGGAEDNVDGSGEREDEDEDVGIGGMVQDEEEEKRERGECVQQ